jgi:S-adenosylmethionine hydrolase
VNLASWESGGVSRTIEGKVVSISEQGNLVTDIPCAALASAPRDGSVSVRCDEHETVGLFSSGHSEPEMSFLALLGDGGFLELTIVGDSAKMMLGIRAGERVCVQW